jgi:hypothetical protein
MKRFFSVAVGAVTASLLLTTLPAAADTTVAVTGTSRSGNLLTVTGTSTHADQPFVQMGTDPADDAETPAPAGQDLVAASLRATADGKLAFRWTLSFLPPGVNGLPVVFYAWTFCAGEENCYELDAGRFYDGPDQTDFSGLLWACADSSCDIAGQSSTATPVTVAVDTTAKTITAAIPASGIGATPGTSITPVHLSSNGAAFSALYDSWASGNVFPDDGDGVAIADEYVVPGKGVSLAVGAPGLDPTTATYTTAAAVASGGGFTGSLDVSALAPGAYTVYARACLGSNNCAYATRDVTL